MTDPLSEIFSLLDVRSARCTRFEAGGRWSFRFPAKPALKFVAVLRGRCLLLLEGDAAPIAVAAGDTFLLAHAPGYVIASDLSLPPGDGIAAFDWAHSNVSRHGGDETVLLAGSFVFEGANAHLLADALPPFVQVSAGGAAGEALRATLAMLDDELAGTRIGASLVTRRLGDILLVQALRAHAAGADGAGGQGVASGWIGALADPKVGEALRLLHRDPGRAWTVAALAGAIGMSRSAFAQRFRARVGTGPLAYLTRWRMHRARDALRRREASVAALAADLGYASESAFGHAFKRMFGRAPKQYWASLAEPAAAVAVAHVVGAGQRPE